MALLPGLEVFRNDLDAHLHGGPAYIICQGLRLRHRRKIRLDTALTGIYDEIYTACIGAVDDFYSVLSQAHEVYDKDFDEYVEEHDGEEPNWDDIVVYFDGEEWGWYWGGETLGMLKHRAAKDFPQRRD